ncbi:MAG: hypothetical protein EU541_08170 [Promethearchaeota archaeon]|nr:MAG: hypothetical protein EU541_08170 [Candidatus Lokiarchaeota archaeon]
MSVASLLKISILQIFQKLTNVKYIRIITHSTLSSYLVLFISSYLITITFGYNNYSPLYNMISQMGSISFTPAPYLFDFACIFSGFLSFPISFYIYRYLNYKINLEPNYKFIKTFLLIFLIASKMLGDIGFIGIGIFSIDRNPFNIHYLFASLLFFGYFLSSFLIGILIIVFKFRLNKFIGLSGLFSSTIICLTYIILELLLLDVIIFEWIASITLIIWFYGFIYSILRMRKKL